MSLYDFYLYQRHAELVDKKFSVGLTTAENDELNHISQKIDQTEGTHYRPLLAMLDEVLKRVKEMQAP